MTTEEPDGGNLLVRIWRGPGGETLPATLQVGKQFRIFDIAMIERHLLDAAPGQFARAADAASQTGALAARHIGATRLEGLAAPRLEHRLSARDERRHRCLQHGHEACHWQ